MTSEPSCAPGWCMPNPQNRERRMRMQLKDSTVLSGEEPFPSAQNFGAEALPLRPTTLKEMRSRCSAVSDFPGASVRGQPFGRGSVSLST